jgi:hypothetical protein
VGEGSFTSRQATATLDEREVELDPASPDVEITESVGPPGFEAGRRRYTWASLIALGLTVVPFLWILWSDWGPLNLLRPTLLEDNYYDLQARAMFHGKLSVATGSLGLEGFVHDGRTYTYFGLFPSLLRMPLLAVTSSLDGKLTPSAMLLSWLLTGLFTSLLFWRVRYMVRGDSVMGRLEAAGYGVLIATVMGGTVWMFLASVPYSFNEDIGWSICLTIGSLFMLLGVIERPTWRRVVASGLLVLCANLDRSTTGWAVAVCAGLIAVWFLLGRAGPENRRWFLPVLAVGVIPVVISCIVNYAKFGVWFGVSNTEQVWTHINAYRRRFLAANHGAEEGLIFVPTNLVTYFRPDGLSISRVFPFVTLPTRPPTGLSGVLFDKLYRTDSITASTPLLFLLSIWGFVTAFRPKAIGQVAKTRLLLLAAGSACAALMLWGYIAPRYLGDFVPFLALASAVAVADIFRRLQGRRRSVRFTVFGVITVLAAFSIVANIGTAIVPNDLWTPQQVTNYVQAQKSVSDLTGHPLHATVSSDGTLPAWGPAGQIVIAGRCDAMYISNGENWYSTVPDQEFIRSAWMPVEYGYKFQHDYELRVANVTRPETVPLQRTGNFTILLRAWPTTDPDRVRLQFVVDAHGVQSPTLLFDVAAGVPHAVTVITDPPKNQILGAVDGQAYLEKDWAATGSTQVLAKPSPLALQVKPSATPAPKLCEGLLH